MIHGTKDKLVNEYFTVADSSGNLISGIDSSSFNVFVYDSTSVEVSNIIGGYFTELGNGNYKYSFIPNMNGIWYVVVTHPTYFPWGKTDDIYVDTEDLSGIYEIVIRTLGLVHHNVYIDNTMYDEHSNLISARVRLYSDKISVGTNNNVIETYLITSDGTACGKFDYWEQTAI